MLEGTGALRLSTGTAPRSATMIVDALHQHQSERVGPGKPVTTGWRTDSHNGAP